MVVRWVVLGDLDRETVMLPGASQRGNQHERGRTPPPFPRQARSFSAAGASQQAQRGRSRLPPLPPPHPLCWAGVAREVAAVSRVERVLAAQAVLDTKRRANGSSGRLHRGGE